MGAKKGVFQADAPWTIPGGFHFMARTSQIFWWRRRDSNLRPRAYESPALPLSYAALHPSKGLDSGGWIRTNDLRVMSPTSCHCSTPHQEYAHIYRIRQGREGVAGAGLQGSRG